MIQYISIIFIKILKTNKMCQPMFRSQVLQQLQPKGVYFIEFKGKENNNIRLKFIKK